MGEIGKLSKGTKWQFCRMNKSGGLMYSMMTICSNTVLTMFAKRVDLRCSYHTHTSC